MGTKKKAYIVKCVVNMSANHVETVIVKTTKPHLAAIKAMSEMRSNGFFHACVISCEEIGRASE